MNSDLRQLPVNQLIVSRLVVLLRTTSLLSNADVDYPDTAASEHMRPGVGSTRGSMLRNQVHTQKQNKKIYRRRGIQQNPGPSGAASMPRLTNRQRCGTSRSCAAFGSFNSTSLQNRSLGPLSCGNIVGIMLVRSTCSPHIHASPPNTR